MMRFKVTVLSAALVAFQAIPSNAGSLVGDLVSKLGVSEAQAAGGVQALLGVAKGKLSAADYASLLQGAPDLGELAKGMANDAVSDATADAVAKQVGVSRVTAWRYLERLADEGTVTRHTDYGRAGRPKTRYQWR